MMAERAPTIYAAGGGQIHSGGCRGGRRGIMQTSQAGGRWQQARTLLSQSSVQALAALLQSAQG
jgi:hypothetical protein|eukprot:SAG25_NODE_1671_length_2575_cov_6.213651_3_plen_64_part_00